MADKKNGSLFCISCWFTCDDQRLYRNHYSSEWHCFNLERKKQKQPHVTEEVFQKLLEKTLERKKLLETELEADRSWHCDKCCKKFKSYNSHQNHLLSKRHLLAIKQAEEKLLQDGVRKDVDDGVKVDDGMKNDDVVKDEDGVRKDDDGVRKDDAEMKDADGVEGEELEEMMEEDLLGEPIPPTCCLFCTKKSASVEVSLQHMHQKHSFFIPDIDFLLDLEGLLTLLGEKVGMHHMCLWCDQRSRIFIETRDVQLHMADKGHCKMYHSGDALLEYSDFYDYRKAYPDYEDDDGDDGEFCKPETLDLDDTGLQLVLPSGATVGHRSLNLFFKQKLNPCRQLTTRSSAASAMQKTIQYYKKIGWKGTKAHQALLKARDMVYLEKKGAKYLKQGIRHNKLQKHFRRQIIGC